MIYDLGWLLIQPETFEMFFSIRLQEGETLFKINSFATSADFLTRIELQSTQLFLAAVHPPEFLGGGRSIQLSYADIV